MQFLQMRRSNGPGCVSGQMLRQLLSGLNASRTRQRRAFARETLVFSSPQLALSAEFSLKSTPFWACSGEASIAGDRTNS